MKALAVITLLCCSLQWAFPAMGATYYISPSGDDNYAGTTPATAWKTIQKLNTIQLHPGDSVLFQGGAVFSGNIYLEANDSGTPSQTVYIGSYGTGRPVIQAGTGFGVWAYNCAGIHLAKLVIQGSGVSTNTASGIEFYMDAATDLSVVKIDSCDVSGFREYGVRFGAWNTTSGFNNVEVRNVNSFDNGNGGMTSYGYNTLFNHTNFYVGYSTFHDNKGRTDITATNTGSGIVLSGIDGATIEYCEAYNNGENNTNPNGGPVGIWFYLVRNGLIQFCESHHNRTGTVDGGGFDLDGGAQNCIIQYCYSHDNAGPGYLLAEYGSGVEFTGNIIRYNISQNDARKSSAGAISFWGANSWNSVRQSMVHNNTVYVDANNIASGTPAAVKLIGNNFSGVKLFNNIFYTSGSVHMLHTDAYSDSTQLHFLSNDYYAATGNPVFIWAYNPYNSLAAWKAIAVTQERRGAIQYGTSVSPQLSGAGTGGTIGVGQLQQMPVLLAGYRLGQNSQVVDIGINMQAVFGASPGSRDFFGNAPRHGSFQDIGAHECSDCYSLLAGNNIQLAARKIQDQVLLSWQVKDEINIVEYVLQYSNNGRDFTTLHIAKPSGSNAYSIADTSAIATEKYYRLQVNQHNGIHYYSNIVRFTGDAGTLMLHFTGNEVIIYSPAQQNVQFLLFNAAGQLVSKESRIIPQGRSHYARPAGLPGRLYILKVIGQTGQSKTISIISK
ncbi:MAG TPA: hypothetical protein VD993_09315 [Chitinophagaceae bacterium]|nr:hypothetical protein [Chitinophagaceae bacterium]